MGHGRLRADLRQVPEAPRVGPRLPAVHVRRLRLLPPPGHVAGGDPDLAGGGDQERPLAADHGDPLGEEPRVSVVVAEEGLPQLVHPVLDLDGVAGLELGPAHAGGAGLHLRLLDGAVLPPDPRGPPLEALVGGGEAAGGVGGVLLHALVVEDLDDPLGERRVGPVGVDPRDPLVEDDDGGVVLRVVVLAAFHGGEQGARVLDVGALEGLERWVEPLYVPLEDGVLGVDPQGLLPAGHGVVLPPQAVEHAALEVEEVLVLGGGGQSAGGRVGGLGEPAEPLLEVGLAAVGVEVEGVQPRSLVEDPHGVLGEPLPHEHLGEAAAGLGVLVVHVQRPAAEVGRGPEQPRPLALLLELQQEAGAGPELLPREDPVQRHRGLRREPAAAEDVHEQQVGLEVAVVDGDRAPGHLLGPGEARERVGVVAGQGEVGLGVVGVQLHGLLAAAALGVLLLLDGHVDGPGGRLGGMEAVDGVLGPQLRGGVQVGAVRLVLLLVVVLAGPVEEPEVEVGAGVREAVLGGLAPGGDGLQGVERAPGRRGLPRRRLRLLRLGRGPGLLLRGRRPEVRQGAPLGGRDPHPESPGLGRVADLHEDPVPAPVERDPDHVLVEAPAPDHVPLEDEGPVHPDLEGLVGPEPERRLAGLLAADPGHRVAEGLVVGPHHRVEVDPAVGMDRGDRPPGDGPLLAPVGRGEVHREPRLGLGTHLGREAPAALVVEGAHDPPPRHEPEGGEDLAGLVDPPGVPEVAQALPLHPAPEDGAQLLRLEPAEELLRAPVDREAAREAVHPPEVDLGAGPVPGGAGRVPGRGGLLHGGAEGLLEGPQRLLVLRVGLLSERPVLQLVQAGGGLVGAERGGGGEQRESGRGGEEALSEAHGDLPWGAPAAGAPVAGGCRGSTIYGRRTGSLLRAGRGTFPP